VIRGHAENSGGLFPQNGVDAESTSLDWNFSSSVIKNISIRVNGTSDPMIEQYNNSLFSIMNKKRTLCEQSLYVIEGSDDIYMTPCLESTTDNTTSLSPEARQRAYRWLSYKTTVGQVTYNNVIFHTKVIPLASISSFVNQCPFFISCKKFEIIIEFKSQSDVLFSTNSSVGQNLYIIDNVELLYDEIKSQYIQEQSNIMSRVNGETQRISFLYYDTLELQYVKSQTFQKPASKNAQGIIFAFGANNVSSTYINKSQFLANNIVRLNVKYGNSLVPMRPIELDETLLLNNIEIYYYYRMLLHKCPIQNFVPAVQFYNGFAPLKNSTNRETYYLYCIPFTPTDTFKLATQDNTIFVNNTQVNGVDQIPVYMTILTAKFFQINPDGTITTVD
jgi:hypothetical protein